MSALGPTEKFARKRMLQLAGGLLLIDFTLHDCDWYLIRCIKNNLVNAKKSFEPNVPYYNSLSAHNVKLLLETTQSQSEKINVLLGPNDIGKSTCLTCIKNKKIEQTYPLTRAVFHLRLGSDIDPKCDLKSSVLKSMDIPERSWILGIVWNWISSAYYNFRGIKHESADMKRMDYAFLLFNEAVQSIHKEKKLELTQLCGLRRKRDFKIPDDNYDSCHPVVIVDEGDHCEVTTPGHDELRKELTRRFLKELIRYSTRHKNIETWISGQDNKLIEDCCVQYKSTVYPRTEYNTLFLEDPPAEDVRNVIMKQQLYTNTGKVIHYDSVAADRVIAVLGTRIVDLINSGILSTYHSREQLDDKLNSIVNRSKEDIEDMFTLCHTVEDRNKLIAVLNNISISSVTTKDNNKVCLEDLPECVRQSEKFNTVFYYAFGKLILQRSVLKYAWKQDKRSSGKGIFW